MRRLVVIFGAILAVQFFSAALAQSKLEGRWEGKVQSPQGERDTSVTFKKQGEGYGGTTVGLRGDEIPFKEVKVDGNKVTAIAVVETPQGGIEINYKFELQGDSLKGEGSVNFGGQTFTFTYDLKRAAEKPAGAPGQPEPQQPPRQPRRIRWSKP